MVRKRKKNDPTWRIFIQITPFEQPGQGFHSHTTTTKQANKQTKNKTTETLQLKR